MLNGCRQTWLILLPMQGREAGLNKATIGGLVAAGKFVDGLVGMTISGNSVVKMYRSTYYFFGHANIPTLEKPTPKRRIL